MKEDNSEDLTPAPAPIGEGDTPLETPDGTTNPLLKQNGDTSDVADAGSPEPEKETVLD